MATTPIQPAIDAYGTYARASNLADHLEILAILGDSVSRAELADLIADQDLTAKMDELFAGPLPAPRRQFEDDEDEVEDAVTGNEGSAQAARVFDVLFERSDVLGALYPFSVDNAVTLKDGVDLETSPYVALLSLTLVHAHKLRIASSANATTLDPKLVLEDVVVRSLRKMGLRAENVGEVSRASNNFRDTIETVGTAVGLKPTPSAAVSLINANEEGVDALAHFASSDSRAGNWVFIGQVTCGKSDTWKKKLAEPSSPSWKLYLNLLVEPLGFLAVPHHVERQQLTKLVQDGNRMVLDRLRIVRFADGVSPLERELIRGVMHVGAERRA